MVKYTQLAAEQGLDNHQSVLASSAGCDGVGGTVVEAYEGGRHSHRTQVVNLQPGVVPVSTAAVARSHGHLDGTFLHPLMERSRLVHLDLVSDPSAPRAGDSPGMSAVTGWLDGWRSPRWCCSSCSPCF